MNDVALSRIDIQFYIISEAGYRIFPSFLGLRLADYLY